MKFLLKSSLTDLQNESNGPQTHSSAPEEQSSVQALADFSLNALIRDLSCNLNSLDSEFQNYQIVVSMEVFTGSIFIQLIKPDPQPPRNRYKEYIATASKSIKIYEEAQRRTVDVYRKTVKRTKQTKLFLAQSLAKFRQSTVLQMRSDCLSRIIEEPKESKLVFKCRTLSEDTNSSMEILEEPSKDVFQSSQAKEVKGAVFCPSCLFQID